MSSVALACVSSTALGSDGWSKDDTKQICLYVGLGLIAYKLVTHSMEQKHTADLCEIKKLEVTLEIEKGKILQTRSEIERLNTKKKYCVFKKDRETNTLAIQMERINFSKNEMEKYCSEADTELCEAFRKNLLKNIEKFQNSSRT